MIGDHIGSSLSDQWTQAPTDFGNPRPPCFSMLKTKPVEIFAPGLFQVTRDPVVNK